MDLGASHRRSEVLALLSSYVILYKSLNFQFHHLTMNGRGNRKMDKMEPVFPP